MRPSAAVTETEVTTTGDGQIETITPERVSECRAERISRLKRQLSGDLDSILAKALRKEPAWRYAAPEQLSEDVSRHLNGLPVLARRDSLQYRAGRLIQRLLFPRGGELHHNPAMLISWGIFGATIFARKHAVAIGFRQHYSDFDMLPVLILSVCLSVREGRRIAAQGYASPMDRQASIVFGVTLVTLMILTILSVTRQLIPEPAMSMFWNVGLGMAFLTLGLQASRILLWGGIALLGSVVAANLDPGWLYGYLSAGLVVGEVMPGIILAFQNRGAEVASSREESHYVSLGL